MKIAALSAVLLGGVAVLAPQAALASARESWSFHADHVLGTSLDIIAVAGNEEMAELASAAAQSEINRLDPILSGWRSDSELKALNSAPAMATSPDLFNVIAAGEKWRASTGGAFSARLGGLDSAVYVTGDQRSRLAVAIDHAPVTLDKASRTIGRPECVRFAIDGLAKGYIIDRAMEAARRVPGIQGLMINIGGDLRCWGAAPTAAGWRIGVVDAAHSADNDAPVAVLNLADRAVATSGRGPRGQTILEPATGQLANHVAMATAVAYHAADADALASAFAVMPPEDSIRLADSIPGVSAHIVAADGQTHLSRDWNDLVVAQAENARKPAADARPVTGAPWPQGFSLKIDYEIPSMGDGRRSRNPYVTLWVTNESGNLVRVLTYLAGKRRYLDENYVFWGRFGTKLPDLVESVTRPTRSPGRYTLIWNGRDDQGRAMPQGNYVLNVEAAREHGGHSIQRINLTLAAGVVSASAPAQDEIGETGVTYGNNP